MKLFIALFATTYFFNFAMAAPKEPKGSVVCEIPDNAETALGESWGTIRARVNSDTLLSRVNLEITKMGANDTIQIQTVASAASKKYTPRNPKYKNSNRFSFETDESASCRFEWLLPQNVSNRVNKFDGYLQQICFKEKKKLPLETLTLTCRFSGEFRLDEDDKSATAQRLTGIAEEAQVANGTADVLKFNKANWNQTRALHRLTYELPNSKDEICKYQTLEVDDVAGTIKAITKLTDDKDVQKAVQKLKTDKNLFKILGRITVDGESEACSRFYFHVYTNDGYMLDLDYDTGD